MTDTMIGRLTVEQAMMEEPQQSSQVQRAPKAKKKGGALDRRPLRFWQPFNDWWRGEFEKSGKRPAADDIMRCVSIHHRSRSPLAEVVVTGMQCIPAQQS
jgi:hypothetical protein